jgi:hypothetical protein
MQHHQVVLHKTFLLFAFLIFSVVTAALLPLDAAAMDNQDDEDEHTEHAHEGHAPRHVAVFTGVANGSTREVAFGADFAHRLPGLDGRLSVGAFADATLFAEHVHTVVGAGLAFSPMENVKITAMPGAEMTSGHIYFAVRTGIGYAFHVGGMSLAPTFNLDFVDGHVNEVFGLNFGFGF